MPRFVWNDETVTNSYGFRVLNAGIDLARFAANPVMQNSHRNTTADNLGSWKDWKTEGFKMSGETVFDSTREVVKEVEGQVDRGFIKACSIGIGISWDEDSWRKAPDGVWELLKCTLMEVSICAVPSNGSALHLYDQSTGELITEDQIKLSVNNLKARTTEVQTQISKMEKVILSTAAIAVLVGLNVTNAENVAEISNAIVSLNAAKTTAEAKVVELQGKLDEQTKTNAKALADQAQLDGKITEGEHAELMNDAILNYNLTAKLVSKMPKKVELTTQVENSEIKLTADGKQPKTMDEFVKLSAEEQLAFQTKNPDAYDKLFA